MTKKGLSESERTELKYLANLPDSEIDTTDIPEALEENWALARRGAFYRPIKQPVTIRLDADVIGWFKDHAESGGYQTEINRVLRQHVAEQIKKSA